MSRPGSVQDDLNYERERAERAENAADNARSKIKEAAEETIQTGVVVGTALAGGYAQGRYGQRQEVFGMPGVTALAGAAVAGVAFGVGGRKYRRYMVSVAQGGLACTAALFGLEAGQEDADEAVSGVGARRGRRGFLGRGERIRDREREPSRDRERDDIPPNLPPGLRNLYFRRRTNEATAAR